MKKYAIVGLGNVGEKYDNTRHNIGFKVLDYISKNKSLHFETAKLGSITSYKIKGRQVILIKPNTYMNLSGKAVKYWMNKEKISLENLLVVTDDLNLPFGTFRLKTKGSHGGHNGLSSIEENLNSKLYSRFRFGIGNNFKNGNQTNYVLGSFSEEENIILEKRLELASQLIESFVLSGVGITMNLFNGK